MSAAVEEFRAAYGVALRSYVADGTETDLRTAYELGREAVVRELSVLDLTLAHHDALLEALGEASADVDHVVRAAAAFVLESLAAFEMVRRGFDEAREAALLERRHAAMLRRLSGFLADVSLALATPGPLDELLQLVAEQARELVGCDWCRVRIAVEPDDVREAVSASEPNEGVADVDAVVRRPGSRLSGREGGSLGDESRVAALTALDGRAIGSIELARKQDGEFGGADEAVLAHLAQMVSAAVERTWLYRSGT